MVEAWLMAGFFGIRGIQYGEIDFAVGKMHRTVFGAVHFSHVEYSFIKVGEFVGLMREDSEMTKLRHNVPPC
jgi:hypothetical protein